MQMFHVPSKKMKKAICTVLLCCVNGLCLGFVVWQTIKCTTKYIHKPQVTVVSLKDSVDLPFPAITICGSFGKDEHGVELGYNETHLKDVCGFSR